MMYLPCEKSIRRGRRKGRKDRKPSFSSGDEASQPEKDAFFGFSD
jgi:hypothetical protein